MSKQQLLSFLLSTTLLLMVACQRTTPVEIANKEQILLKANGTDPSDLDPHTVTGVPEYRVLLSLMEGLMRPHPKTLEPMPAVAESYSISEDGKTYTFKIRKNARWSNGDPLTADDFVFSFRRILSPAFGAEYAYMLYPMVNARAFNTGELKAASKLGAEAIDKQTLKISLTHPTPYFLSLLYHISWWPVHPPTILKYGAIDERGTRWTRQGNFIGNGPFTLSKWSVSDVIKVKKNPLYWDTEKVRLNGINFYPIDNINTEERIFRADQVHITNSIPLAKIEGYKQLNKNVLKINPYLGTYYYLLNTKHPPLNDSRVRQALSLTINRKLIVNNILKGGQEPAYHFTPPGTAGYHSDYHIGEDVAKARQLLAEAGYPNGKGFPRLEILYNTSENHRTIAEAIQQMWKQSLNIDFRLINQDWKVYLNSRRHGDFDVARAAWIGDYNDPSNFLELFTSYSGNNHSGWIALDYDKLVDEASQTADPNTRMHIFQDAEEILLKAAPIIPIYFYKSAYLVKPSVHGWYPNILDLHPYQDVWLDTKEEG